MVEGKECGGARGVFDHCFIVAIYEHLRGID